MIQHHLRIAPWEKTWSPFLAIVDITFNERQGYAIGHGVGLRPAEVEEQQAVRLRSLELERELHVLRGDVYEAQETVLPGQRYQRRELIDI